MKNKRGWKNEIWLENCRKNHRNRMKCWLPAFSPFPTTFSKVLFFKAGYQHFLLFPQCFQKSLIQGWLPAFSPFPTMFSKVPYSRLVTSIFPFSHNVFKSPLFKAGYQHFSPFPTMFSKVPYSRLLKVGIVCETVKQEFKQPKYCYFKVILTITHKG